MKRFNDMVVYRFDGANSTCVFTKGINSITSIDLDKLNWHKDTQDDDDDSEYLTLQEIGDQVRMLSNGYSGESWCAQIDDVDLRYYPNIAERPLCENQFMEVVEHKPEIDWIFTHRNDFGKTVFLNREEAEAALKGGEV